VVTVGDESAPACCWGRPGYPPLPLDALGTAEFDAIGAADADHHEWRSGVSGLECQIRPELLYPEEEA